MRLEDIDTNTVGIGIAACAAVAAIACRSKIATVAHAALDRLITSCFYVGFKRLDPTLAAQRRQARIDNNNARPIMTDTHPSPEALYIPSPSSTGNVMVICLNTTYQDHHPKRWKPFLESGADIVLWNPTKLDPVSYSQELSAVLAHLRQQNPNQVIAVHSRCASTDPAIAAIAAQNDPNIHLLVDRGHGNSLKLASSMSRCANLPFVRNLLQQKFDCGGEEKIANLPGKTAFFVSECDQLLGKKDNLTHDLVAKTPNSTTTTLRNSDHWSDWSFEDYNAALKFLASLGVVRSDFTPVIKQNFPAPTPPNFFMRSIVPFLIKRSC